MRALLFILLFALNAKGDLAKMKLDVSVLASTYLGEELAFLIKIQNKSTEGLLVTKDQIDIFLGSVILERDTNKEEEEKKWGNLSLTPLAKGDMTGLILGKGKWMTVVVYAPPSRLLVSSDFDEKVKLRHSSLRGVLNYTVSRKNGGIVSCVPTSMTKSQE